MLDAKVLRFRHDANFTWTRRRRRDRATILVTSANSSSRAALLLSLAAFGPAFSMRVADPQLPALASAFGITVSAAAQVVTTFSIAYGLLQFVYGPLGDRYGKWRVINIACFACATATCACALATDFFWLLLARLGAGATCAAIVPLSLAYLGDTVPYEQRQPVLARFLLGQMTGFAAGQVIGGMSVEFATWRLAYWLIALCFIAAGLAMTVARHASPPAASQRGGGLWRDVPYVLRQPWARVVLLVVFLEGVLMYGPFVFFPTYLAQRHGASLAAAGAVMLFFSLGGVAFSLSSVRLVPRLGEPGLTRMGGGLLALSFAAVAVSPVFWSAPLAVTIVGLGFYLLHNTLQTNATQMAPAARGAAVSLFASAFFIGQTVGVALGAIAVHALGVAPVTLAGGAALAVLGWGFARRRQSRLPAPTVAQPEGAPPSVAAEAADSGR